MILADKPPSQNTLNFTEGNAQVGNYQKTYNYIACVNMEGTDKVKLLVIGKSINLICLKLLKNLQVKYKINKKPWSTSELYKEKIEDLG